MGVGRRILITGASSGIGAATALRLAAPDRCLLLHYAANRKGAEATAAQVTAAGATVELQQADLSQADGRAGLMQAAGEVDVLINNAGGPLRQRALGQYTEADLSAILGLNFIAPFFLCQSVFPGMVSRDGGCIVNVSSIGVKFGGGDQTVVYSAAKSALEVVTVNLAKRGAERNVRVNTVRAGVIDTPQHQRYGKDLEARARLIPMKRCGTADEVAAMIAFLISDQAAYITGQTFAVSGGE